MSVMGRLWREQRVVMVAFVLALALTGFFGGRIVVSALYWANPAHHRQDPEPWMTPGYLARSWQVPSAAVYAVVDFDPARYDSRRRPSLARLARAQGIPVEALIADLRAALPQLPPLPPGADPDAPLPAATPAIPAPAPPTPPGRAP